MCLVAVMSTVANAQTKPKTKPAAPKPKEISPAVQIYFEILHKWLKKIYGCVTFQLFDKKGKTGS